MQPEVKTFTVSRQWLRGFLDELSGLPEPGALTLYFPPLEDKVHLETRVKDIPVPAGIKEDVVSLASHSATGSVLFYFPGRQILVVPPFPITDNHISPSLDTESLRTLISTDYLIGLVLVRLGSYAIGVCRGEELIESKVGTGLVHGRHKKGGSSAHRFERHRDKQIEYFLTRVCERSRQHLEPYVKSFDYLVYGGARTTLTLLKKQCPFFNSITTSVLPPLLDIPEPRQKALEAAVTRVWSSKITEWREV